MTQKPGQDIVHLFLAAVYSTDAGTSARRYIHYVLKHLRLGLNPTNASIWTPSFEEYDTAWVN